MGKPAVAHQRVGGRSILTALCLFIFCIFLSARTPAQSADLIASDFDGSGRVDFSDFLAFAGAFGKSTGQEGFDTKFDLDNSTVIDFGDFLVFAGNFGKSTTGIELSNFLYIAELLSGKVRVVDIESNLTIPSKEFDVPFPRGIAFGPQSGLVYVATPDSLFAYTDQGQRSFSIELSQIESQATGGLTGPGGFKVKINRNETRAFVTEDAGMVEVFDLLNRVSLAQIAVGNRPVGMELSADETELYVGRAATSIAVINVGQLALVDSIVIGTAASSQLASNAEGSIIYASNLTSNALHTSGSLVQALAIDPKARSVTDSVQISRAEDFTGQVVDLSVSDPAGVLLLTYSRTAPADLGDLTGFAFSGDLIFVALPSFTVTKEVSIGEVAGSFGISPDGATAYVFGSDTIGSQEFRVFLVDVSLAEKLSALPIVLDSGVEFVFTTAKQAVDAALSLIDLALFGN